MVRLEERLSVTVIEVVCEADRDALRVAMLLEGVPSDEVTVVPIGLNTITQILH